MRTRSLAAPRVSRVYVAASVLSAATALLPPVATAATRTLWVEALQFLLLAFGVPVFAALALPARLRPVRHGQRWMILALVLEAALQIVWRTPTAVDGLAHHWGLVLLEGATLAPVGLLLWSFLVAGRSPGAERTVYPWRMSMAAIAMWTTWMMAYLVGFSGSQWYPAYRGQPGLSLIADQQLTSGLLWLGSGLAYLPTIFWCLWQLLAPERGGSKELV
ncbi:MAG: cytochrome c oxidase assembly protein [Acidobacteriota bacterium]|nr:cytochrome c oxidase assembly protein [Acidobacteriota bacterium]